jgi:hypothetical protein
MAEDMRARSELPLKSDQDITGRLHMPGSVEGLIRSRMVAEKTGVTLADGNRCRRRQIDRHAFQPS